MATWSSWSASTASTRAGPPATSPPPSRAAPDAILVPKVSRPEDIRRIRAALRAAGADPSLAIWAMIETPLAILNAGAIGAVATADQGAPRHRPRDRHQRPCRRDRGAARAATARRWCPGSRPACSSARAYELIVIDGIYNDFNDADGFAAECAQARMLGMDGKSMIHPNQVGPCNASLHAVARGDRLGAVDPRRVRPRRRRNGRDPVSVNGRMVERLHARIARRGWLPRRSPSAATSGSTTTARTPEGGPRAGLGFRPATS